MTELLEKAFRAARNLSPERQDDIARTVLEFVHSDAVALTAEEKAAIGASKAAAARGEFASEDSIRGVWAKYDL